MTNKQMKNIKLYTAKLTPEISSAMLVQLLTVPVNDFVASIRKGLLIAPQPVGSSDIVEEKYCK